ncbi:MAG: hypothetical protein VKK59_08020, partial [Vampirovibrionales bacterium]|nr:hypothetical protein [Vampirovibrionales bacterium]
MFGLVSPSAVSIIAMTVIKMPGVLDTYLSACLHNGRLARWPDKLFPIGVYIAPFHWYEAKKQ